MLHSDRLLQRAWIGLGSNLGDPADHLRRALAALADLPESRAGPVSGFYRTAPVGVTDQPAFCNAVAALDTALTPVALLAALQDIERAHGRRRNRRWGPRTLDLDLLLYGQRRIDRPELTVPHPRMPERGFVLLPLAAVAPDCEIPGHGRVADLLTALPTQEVVPWT